MITQTKKFYYVESDKYRIRVRREDFPDGPLPLMWFNQGMCSVIRVEIINNLIQQLNDLASLPKLEVNQQGAVLHWDDTYTVTSTGARGAVDKALKIVCVKQTH